MTEKKVIRDDDRQDNSDIKGIRKVNEDIWGRPLDKPIKVGALLAVNTKKHVRQAIKNEWDYPIVVVGYEGSGKSTLAFSLAKMCNANFSEKDIVFNVSQLIEWTDSDERKTGDVVVFDECDELSGRSNDAQVKRVTTQIKRVRKRRREDGSIVGFFVIIFATPTFKDMSSYFRGRLRSLFYVYANDWDDRGYFHLYNQDQVSMLIDELRKRVEVRKTYERVKPAIPHGLFKNTLHDVGIDVTAYEKAKLEGSKGVALVTDPRKIRQEIAEAVGRRWLLFKKEGRVPLEYDKDVAELLGYTAGGFFELTSRLKEESP